MSKPLIDLDLAVFGGDTDRNTALDPGDIAKVPPGSLSMWVLAGYMPIKECCKECKMWLIQAPKVAK